MHSALASIRRPQLALIGWAHVASRLEHIGIRIVVERLPEETLGELDEQTGVLRIRHDAPLDDQMWLMQQAWNWIVFGPHASPHGRLVPHLRLVIPPQRSDETVDEALA